MKLLQIVALAFTGLLAGCTGNTAGGSVSAQSVAPAVAPETPRTQISADKLEPNVQTIEKAIEPDRTTGATTQSNLSGLQRPAPRVN